MSNGSYYILAFSFPAASNNPLCVLTLGIDSGFAGGSYSITVNGQYDVNIFGASVLFTLPGGSQVLGSRLAISEVASISGMISVETPLTTDVTLSVPGGETIATLTAGNGGEKFTFTFPDDARSYTQSEVLHLFKAFTNLAA